MKDEIRKLLDQWKSEYDNLKEQLIVMGDKPDSKEYNLLSTEALKLNECRLDLTDLLFIDEKKENSGML